MLDPPDGRSISDPAEIPETQHRCVHLVFFIFNLGLFTKEPHDVQICGVILFTYTCG